MSNKNPILIKLFEAIKNNDLSEEEQQRYDVSLKRKWDTYATMNYAREEGRQQGKEEGRQEEGYKFVKNNLLKLDLTNKEIASLANVNLAFAEQVRKDLKF